LPHPARSHGTIAGIARSLRHQALIYEDMGEFEQALALVIVTEMFIGTHTGLGRRIVDSQLVYDTPTVYAAIVWVGIIGYLVNRLFVAVERRYGHWAGR